MPPPTPNPLQDLGARIKPPRFRPLGSSAAQPRILGHSIGCRVAMGQGWQREFQPPIIHRPVPTTHDALQVGALARARGLHALVLANEPTPPRQDAPTPRTTALLTRSDPRPPRFDSPAPFPSTPPAVDSEVRAPKTSRAAPTAPLPLPPIDLARLPERLMQMLQILCCQPGAASEVKLLQSAQLPHAVQRREALEAVAAAQGKPLEAA